MAMLPPDPVFIYKGEMSSIMCLSFKITPFYEHLFAGTEKGMIHVWDLKTNRQVYEIQAGKESCLSINIPDDEDNVLLSQDKAGVIRFWTKEHDEWSCLKELQTDYYGFCKCIISEGILFAPIRDSCVQTISISTRESIETFKLRENEKLGEIMAFKLVKMIGKIFFIAIYESCHLYLWDWEVKKKVSEMKFDDCPMAMDFDSISMKGVCGTPSEKVIVFYLDKNFQFHVKKEIVLTNPGVAAVSIRPDNKVVALGCWDGKLRLYSWKSLVLLAVLDIHLSTVQDVCFGRSINSRYLLAAGSKDTKISLWDLYN